jgi:hypothetical protein
MEIRSIKLAPIVPQSGNIVRASRVIAHRQSPPLMPKAYNPYAASWEESITCRETTTGTYEAISGNDSVILEQSNRKGQIVDIWL